MTLSDGELVKQVEQFLAENPYATRNLMLKKLRTSMQRLQRLHDEGLIKLPNRVPKNMCHVFCNQTKWRKFRLKGSPTKGMV